MDLAVSAPPAPPPVAVRLRGVVRLVRPLNVVMFWLGVALGGFLTAGFEAFEGTQGVRLLIAAVSASLIGAAANAINDVFDLGIDRINRPERPLPAGLLAPRAAVYVWAAASLAGVALGVALSPQHVAIAAVSVAAGFVYSWRLKRMPLAGNLAVAVFTPLALVVYGGWAVGEPGPALVAAAFAFLTTLAREIVKDVEDVAGDASTPARTLPIVYGVDAALRLAAGVLVLTVVLTPVPFLFLGYGSLYLLVVLAADALLLRVLWLLLGPDAERNAGAASRLTKAAMLAGIAALAVGAVG